MAKLKDLSQQLKQLQKQIPFATAQAMTTVVREIAAAQKVALGRKLESPTPFTVSAVGASGARTIYPLKDKAMSVRAKFQCNSINKSSDNSTAVVHLIAVTTGSAENESWSKYTPSGQLQMVISNPAAFEQFEQGKEYFIDIVPAE